MISDLHEMFEKHNDEFIKFDRVKEPLHTRPDICAFLLLDKLVPNPASDIVGGAEHDVIYLNTDCDALAAAATEDDIVTLVRCGVMYDDEYQLSMFV